MRRGAALTTFFAWLIACGTVVDATPIAADLDAGLEGGSGPSDAAPNVPADPDAATVVPSPCDLSKPWGAPAPIFTDPAECYTAALSEDELTIFFDRRVATSASSSRMAIFTTTRTERTARFGAGAELDEPVASAGNNVFLASLSPNALTLVFTSDRKGDGFHLFRATRLGTAARFSGVTELLKLGSGSMAQDTYSFITTDGEIWFASERPTEGGELNIFRGVPGDGGTYPTPAQLVAELDTPSEESHPVLTRDGRTIFFSSNRRVDGGKDWAIWTASRADRTATFGPPTIVAELDSTGDDHPVWISSDACRLYLQRDARIYVSSHPR